MPNTYDIMSSSRVDQVWDGNRTAIVNILMGQINNVTPQMAHQMPNKMDLSHILYPKIRNHQTNNPNNVPVRDFANSTIPTLCNSSFNTMSMNMFNNKMDEQVLLSYNSHSLNPHNGFISYPDTNLQSPLTNRQIEGVVSNNISCMSRQQMSLSSKVSQRSSNSKLSKGKAASNGCKVYPGSLLFDDLNYLSSLSSSNRSQPRHFIEDNPPPATILNHDSERLNRREHMTRLRDYREEIYNQNIGRSRNETRIAKRLMELFKDAETPRDANCFEENRCKIHFHRSKPISSRTSLSNSSISPSESMVSGRSESIGASSNIYLDQPFKRLIKNPSKKENIIHSETKVPSNSFSSFTESQTNGDKRKTHILNKDLPLKKRKVLNIEGESLEGFDCSKTNEKEKYHTNDDRSQAGESDNCLSLPEESIKLIEGVMDKHEGRFEGTQKIFLPMEPYLNSDDSDDDILIIDCDAPIRH